MLKYVVVLFCAVSLTSSAPQDVPKSDAAPPKAEAVSQGHSSPVPILSQSEEIEKDGAYKFSFKTGDGISREESGYEKPAPEGRSEDSTDKSFHVQEGSYSYTAPNGQIISVHYIADENGFRPVGDHIPKADSSPSISSKLASSDIPASTSKEVKLAPLVSTETKLEDASTSAATTNASADETTTAAAATTLPAITTASAAVTTTAVPTVQQSETTPVETASSTTQNS